MCNHNFKPSVAPNYACQNCGIIATKNLNTGKFKIRKDQDEYKERTVNILGRQLKNQGRGNLKVSAALIEEF